MFKLKMITEAQKLELKCKYSLSLLTLFPVAWCSQSTLKEVSIDGLFHGARRLNHSEQLAGLHRGGLKHAGCLHPLLFSEAGKLSEVA